MKLIFPKFEDIKTMYGWTDGYTNEQIKWFVEKGAIDKEEYVLITGQRYPDNADTPTNINVQTHSYQATIEAE